MDGTSRRQLLGRDRQSSINHNDSQNLFLEKHSKIEPIRGLTDWAVAFGYHIAAERHQGRSLLGEMATSFQSIRQGHLGVCCKDGL